MTWVTYGFASKPYTSSLFNYCLTYCKISGSLKLWLFIAFCNWTLQMFLADKFRLQKFMNFLKWYWYFPQLEEWSKLQLCKFANIGSILTKCLRAQVVWNIVAKKVLGLKSTSSKTQNGFQFILIFSLWSHHQKESLK